MSDMVTASYSGDVQSLRALLEREDVIEAATRAAWANTNQGIRAAFAAVLELAEAEVREIINRPGLP